MNITELLIALDARGDAGDRLSGEAAAYIRRLFDRISAAAPQVEGTVNCIRHPDAPHGFDRSGSHNAGRYMCQCENWRIATPIDGKTFADAIGTALAAPKPTHRATGWVAPVDRYAVPVLFNPYTGNPRDVRDVQSDPQGILIVPPGKIETLASTPNPVTEACQQWRESWSKPLSDAEILGLGPGQEDAVWSYADQVYFARAIEAAIHGRAA